MPPTEKHQQISLSRTGKDYFELHAWINDPEQQLSRHDFTRIFDFIPEIQQKFGEEGVREYIEHLRIDMEMKFTRIWGEGETVRNTALEYFGIRPKSS